MNRFIISLLLCLIGVIVMLSFLLNNEKKERKRIYGNQRALLSDIAYYRTSDSLSASRVERLLFTSREFELYCGDLKQEIEVLRLKVKRLQSVSQTGMRTDIVIDTPVKDSFRYEKDTIRCIEFSDTYVNLSGCMANGRFSGFITSYDTLIQVVHRVPKRWWFFKWGTKAIQQEIVSKNPYTHITFSKYIEIE